MVVRKKNNSKQTVVIVKKEKLSKVNKFLALTSSLIPGTLVRMKSTNPKRKITDKIEIVVNNKE